MLRYLPVLLSLALTVYCVVDAIQTDGSRVRNLPKTAWVLVILIAPLVGPIAWLVAGRPEKQTGPVARRRWEDQQRQRDARRPRGPDDDPDFLKGL